MSEPTGFKYSDYIVHMQDELKQLRKENERLKKAVKILTLSDKVTDEVAHKIQRSIYSKYTKISYKVKPKALEDK